MGVPVIGSDIRGIRDLVEQTGGGTLYPPGDIAALDRSDQLAVVLAHGVLRPGEVGEQRHEVPHAVANGVEQ